MLLYYRKYRQDNWYRYHFRQDSSDLDRMHFVLHLSSLPDSSILQYMLRCIDSWSGRYSPIYRQHRGLYTNWW